MATCQRLRFYEAKMSSGMNDAKCHVDWLNLTTFHTVFQIPPIPRAVVAVHTEQWRDRMRAIEIDPRTADNQDFDFLNKLLNYSHHVHP